MLTMTKRSAAGTVVAAAMALGALVPAAVAGPTIVGRQLQETKKSPTIVAVALAANADEDGPFYEQLDTLIAAVLAADPAVLAYLQGNGQRTVFAPTDAAFEALGLTPENVGTALTQEALTQILLYHVARGNRDAAEVTASSRIRTLEGGFLLQVGGVLTDERGRTATIIATDVPAGNGIIHVIDAVVLPEE
jgi:uncharacterized surface protein with fasciclin (FAS1) repeats